MNLLKKAAISLAVTSMIAAPVAASGQIAFQSSRATSDVSGENELGGSGWIIAILALAAVAGGIALAADSNDDAPTSP